MTKNKIDPGSYHIQADSESSSYHPQGIGSPGVCAAFQSSGDSSSLAEHHGHLPGWDIVGERGEAASNKSPEFAWDLSIQHDRTERAMQPGYISWPEDRSVVVKDLEAESDKPYSGENIVASTQTAYLGKW